MMLDVILLPSQYILLMYIQGKGKSKVGPKKSFSGKNLKRYSREFPDYLMICFLLISRSNDKTTV